MRIKIKYSKNNTQKQQLNYNIFVRQSDGGSARHVIVVFVVVAHISLWVHFLSTDTHIHTNTYTHTHTHLYIC